MLIAATRRPVDRLDVEDAPATAGAWRRRHGAKVPFDRQELERSGWRTTLDYRENHVRRRDGRLDHLEVVWRAEAERVGRGGEVLVVSASGRTPERAWSGLRRAADLAARRATERDDGSPAPNRARSGPPRRQHR